MRTGNIVKIDPYQLLFPLGLLHSLVGAGLWVAFALGWADYPGINHAQHMIPGFLLSFAAGFLLTAVPRFTGSSPCSAVELSIAALISLLLLIWPHAPATLGMLLFLTVFFGRRLVTRSYSPPPHFILVPVGMLLGILGAAILTGIEFGALSPEATQAGRLLLYYGPILCFVLGIGSKLITALFGWGEAPLVKISNAGIAGRRNWSARLREAEPALLAIALVAGFVLEIQGLIVPGRSLRAAVVSSIAFPRWKLHRLPRQKGRLPLWLWLSAWMLVAGLWLQALLPELGVHAAHLYFVGGFGLMTLMVASRVTLAHGGYDTRLEASSRVFTLSGALVLVAAWTRFSAWAAPNYANHLAYAALVWIAATTIWAIFFVPRMARKSPT